MQSNYHHIVVPVPNPQVMILILNQEIKTDTMVFHFFKKWMRMKFDIYDMSLLKDIINQPRRINPRQLVSKFTLGVMVFMDSIIILSSFSLTFSRTERIT